MSAGQGTAPELVPAGLPALRLLEDQAEAFVRAAKAPSTLRAYRSDWDHFFGWSRQHTLSALPASPETVALYLTALAATHRPATMTRRLTAITKAHAIAGHPSPATPAYAGDGATNQSAAADGGRPADGGRFARSSGCYPEIRAVLQALSSSTLSLLMVATLLWGGCISCPQFFMFPTTAKAEKSCCQKKGQCERPTKTAPAKECKRMPLEAQGFASADAQLAVVAVLPATIELAPVSNRSSESPHPAAPLSEHSPPDLNVLHATFLI
jgi:hypothetical protein